MRYAWQRKAQTLPDLPPDLSRRPCPLGPFRGPVARRGICRRTGLTAALRARHGQAPPRPPPAIYTDPAGQSPAPGDRTSAHTTRRGDAAWPVRTDMLRSPDRESIPLHMSLKTCNAELCARAGPGRREQDTPADATSVRLEGLGHGASRREQRRRGDRRSSARRPRRTRPDLDDRAPCSPAQEMSKRTCPERHHLIPSRCADRRGRAARVASSARAAAGGTSAKSHSFATDSCEPRTTPQERARGRLRGNARRGCGRAREHPGPRRGRPRDIVAPAAT
jgi:hypothetical protein